MSPRPHSTSRSTSRSTSHYTPLAQQIVAYDNVRAAESGGRSYPCADRRTPFERQRDADEARLERVLAKADANGAP